MTLLRWGGVSLAWSCFKWFFSASASADPGVASCGGFASWPTFGFKALDLTWNFDSSLTYIGVGALPCTPRWPPRAAPADLRPKALCHVLPAHPDRRGCATLSAALNLFGGSLRCAVLAVWPRGEPARHLAAWLTAATHGEAP